jgi:WD40 repeat protein
MAETDYKQRKFPSWHIVCTIAIIAILTVAPTVSAKPQHKIVPVKTFKFGCIVFSLDTLEDGNLVAAGGAADHVEYGGSSTGRVSVWDLRTGGRLWRHNTADSVSFVRFLPGGKRLLCIGHGIDEYDAHTGKLLHTMPLKDGYRGVALSADGMYLACIPQYTAMTIVVYDLKTGGITTRLKEEDGFSDSAIAFQTNGRILAVGRGDAVVLINPANGRTVKEISERGYAIQEIAFASDGTTLAVQRNSEGKGGRYSIDLRNTVKGESMRVISPTLVDAARSVSMSPDCEYIAYWWSKDEAYEVGVSSALGGKPRCIFRGAKSDIFVLRFSRDGKLLLAGGDDRVVWVWNMRDIIGDAAAKPKLNTKPK